MLVLASTRGGIVLLTVGIRNVPVRPSQRLLGWPSGLVENECDDLALLKAVAALRARELDLRYRGRSDL